MGTARPGGQPRDKAPLIQARLLSCKAAGTGLTLTQAGLLAPEHPQVMTQTWQQAVDAATGASGMKAEGTWSINDMVKAVSFEHREGHMTCLPLAAVDW